MLRAADLDRDGDVDAVIANAYHGWPSFFVNNGTGTFQTDTPSLGVTQNSVAIADLNTDGWNDVVLASAAANALYVMTNNRTSSFAAPIGFPSAAGPLDVGLADLNRDGALDMAAPCSGAAGVRVWLSNP